MSEPRRSVFECAVDYAGDPRSFETRHRTIWQFLQDEGAIPGSRILEIGCGPLGLARFLIPWLHPGHYTALEPNQWLVEAALNEFFPGDGYPLDSTFLYRDDFLAASQGQFDLIVAHSVLSHAADWQLEQCLANVRKAARDGATFLCSLRLDQYDKGARRWVYPDVSYFRLETVQTLGRHIGWQVERVPEYKQRMTEVAPRDVHDWLRLTSVPSAADWNQVRVDEEARQQEEREILEVAEAEYRRRQSERLIGLGQ